MTTTDSSSITRATSAIIPRSIDEVARLAAMAYASGLAKLPSAPAAGVVIMAGMELGLTPMQALMGMHLVEGRPILAADTIVALVRRSPLCEVWRLIERGDERCTIETRRVGDETVRRTWTIDDARRAGLLSRRPWQQYPADMLRHRCAAALAREVYPDIVLGMGYTREEITDGDYVGPEPVALVAASPASERPAPLPAPAAVPSLASIGVEAPAATAPRAVATLGLSDAEMGAMLALLDGAATVESLDEIRAEIRPDVSTRATADQRRTLRERAEARRAALSPTPTDDPPKTRRSARKAPAVDATGDGASSEPAPAGEALASRERVASLGGVRAYLASKGSAREVERAVRAHGRHVTGFVDAATERLEALTPADHHGARVSVETLRHRVELWASEGPVAQVQRAA